MMLKNQLPGKVVPAGLRAPALTPKVASPQLGKQRASHVVSVQAPNFEPSLTPTGSREELPAVLESRYYRRTVADPAWWEDYLSTERYVKNLTSVFDSRVIRAIYGPLTRVILTSLVVCGWETARSQGVFPESFPSICMPNTMPLGMTSFAISLLLVFRTNQSYSRWWEARKIWGTILNRVRDINTQACVFIPEDEQHYRIAIRNYSVSFARTLEAHLQGRLVERPLEENLKTVLPPKELEEVMNSQHKVVKSISMLAEVANQASINSIERMMLMQNVQVFYDMLGMCERIMRTPMPQSYTRHTSRFLFFFNQSLPFALFPTFGWGCIPLSVGISALLLGIDEIGVQIEEPFAVHHLDPLCKTCEANARAIVGDQQNCADYVREMRQSSARLGSATRSVPLEAR